MRRALLVAVLVICASRLGAQDSRLEGRVVRVGTNAPIVGAEVRLEPMGRSTQTDSAGNFRFDGLPNLHGGPATIYVRRIGFQADSLSVVLPASAPIDIELREAVQQLDTVSVTGKQQQLVRGKLSGFYERKQFGIGRFIEAQDIEKMLTRRLADILVARLPGTRAIRSARGGMAAFIATTRMTPNALLNAQKGAMSGGTGRPPPCYASIYLDGTVVFSSGSEQSLPPGMRADDVLFDINSIDPASISAIEFYAGAGQLPAQYNRTGSACGALLVWTK